MRKTRGFNIPVINENLDSYKKQLKEYHKIPEEKLDLLFGILMESKKSQKTTLEDEDTVYTWNDGLYSTIFKMLTRCPTSYLESIIKMKSLKFNTLEMPINYITKVLRTGIQEKNALEALLDDDLSKMRQTLKDTTRDVHELSNEVPKAFNQLINKVNRMEINRESKIHLTNIVNEHHRRFQEWITKKSR